jgi:hypothetical protein
MTTSKSTHKVSTHCTTAKGGARKIQPPDGESIIRFAETLKLRTLAESTQSEYLRFVRKIGGGQASWSLGSRRRSCGYGTGENLSASTAAEGPLIFRRHRDTNRKEPGRGNTTGYDWVRCSALLNPRLGVGCCDAEHSMMGVFIVPQA